MPRATEEGCDNCNETGLIGGETCPYCGGDGLIPMTNCPHARIEWNVYQAITELDTLILPTDVFNSYVVLEELDPTEYAALTDTQKEGILHLLACGKVDLNDGKAGRVRLWNWFGAESTTVANLTALLT